MANDPGGRQRANSTDELESQLRETVERYELIFKATNDVLYEIDLQSGAVMWNEALYDQYGYSKTEPAGQLEWWAEHVHPDDALRLEREISEWFDRGHDTWQSEYRFSRADNTYVNVRDRGVAQRATDGTPLRIIGSFLDITRQKQLDRAKDEFISLVSHQLRTPLTAIRIYSEMLAQGAFGPLDSDQQVRVRDIMDASVRLIKLVGDILSISRVELGHAISSPVPMDINAFLHTHIKEVSPIAVQKGVAIRFVSCPDIRQVRLDAAIFDQIVYNLLTNAIRYTKPQKGIVVVAFKRNASGYLLSVKDNGIGIPGPAQPHVFDRFYRADNAVNIKEQGTGLGLYLTKLMCEATGCTVWFESAKSKGTTFYGQLPPEGMKAS